MIKLKIYIIICLGIYSCEGKNNEVSNLTDIHENVVVLNDSTLEKSTNFRMEGIDFKFICKNGDFEIRENQPDIRRPQRLEQTLEIKYGKEVKKIELPNKNKQSYLKNGDTIYILDIPIDHFEIFKYKSQNYFELSGGGGCSSCNEYVSIYNFQGQLVFKNYYNKDSTIEYYSNPNFTNIVLKNHRKKLKKIMIE